MRRWRETMFLILLNTHPMYRDLVEYYLNIDNQENHEKLYELLITAFGGVMLR